MSFVSFYLFPSAVLLQVSGADATRYLHARLSNDIRSLATGKSCLAAALNAQGRAEAVFSVHKLQDDYLLVCDGGIREEVVSAFKKFIVADRVEVTDRSDEWRLIHVVGTQLPPHPSVQHVLLRHRFPEAGSDLVVERAGEAQLLALLQNAGGSALSAEDATRLRILANRPAFPEEVATDRVFSEFGISEALSFNKGCYVGQEVLEKIDSHGKAPRALRRLRVDGVMELKRGDEVRSGETIEASQKIGEIVSAARDEKDSKTYAFASLKNTEATEGMKLWCGETLVKLI